MRWLVHRILFGSIGIFQNASPTTSPISAEGKTRTCKNITSARIEKEMTTRNAKGEWALPSSVTTTSHCKCRGAKEGTGIWQKMFCLWKVEGARQDDGLAWKKTCSPWRNWFATLVLRLFENWKASMEYVSPGEATKCWAATSLCPPSCQPIYHVMWPRVIGQVKNRAS